MFSSLVIMEKCVMKCDWWTLQIITVLWSNPGLPRILVVYCCNIRAWRLDQVLAHQTQLYSFNDKYWVTTEIQIYLQTARSCHRLSSATDTIWRTQICFLFLESWQIKLSQISYWVLRSVPRLAQVKSSLVMVVVMWEYRGARKTYFSSKNQNSFVYLIRWVKTMKRVL